MRGSSFLKSCHVPLFSNWEVLIRSHNHIITSTNFATCTTKHVEFPTWNLFFAETKYGRDRVGHGECWILGKVATLALLSAEQYRLLCESPHWSSWWPNHLHWLGVFENTLTISMYFLTGLPFNNTRERKNYKRESSLFGLLYWFLWVLKSVVQFNTHSTKKVISCNT